MMACNLRLLLVAAIFLSNCITWTTSRHHYTHSGSGHRIRHRRQGAGQYLSASYVLPGGEGSGWGAWGEVSPCSRTCGGGVASQKRICLKIGPDGTPYCTGGSKKYFSCQTQDCPEGSGDFRAQQCSEFDDKEFRGFKYKWVPYTHVPNPCELTCMPHGDRFYYRHKEKVVDGTRCTDDSFDVCVDGQCQPVGCDMMLGSKAVEDKCRVCRGNGDSCRTYNGIFNSQDLVKGYNDILLIPEGSTTIVLEEIAPSRNYLALRAKNGTFYLNGHYHIDFPRSILIAGALWTYERSPQGYMAPDRLRTLGPTTEPLYLALLLQDDNVGIQYEYSVPNTTAPPTDKQYNWVHEEFSPCSHTCGGGIQTRNVTCRSRQELEVVDDGLCDAGLKPPTDQACNSDPCPAQWVEGSWGNCSQRCGKGGVRSREVRCEQIVANGHPASIIDENECLKSLGPKPDLFEKCNEDVPCPTWFVGQWKPCDRLCDAGKQTRQVVCHQKVNGRVTLLDDEVCAEEKPESEKPCFLYPCEGVDWVTSEWIGCDSCLSINRTRIVACATKKHVVLNDTFCAQHNKPATEEPCDSEQLPNCEVQWYATQWSKCSVECGEGQQTRKVFCGFFDGEAVQKVNESSCADQPRYRDTKTCLIPKEKCPSQWYAGPWQKCSKPCDGGTRSRTVMCLKGDLEDPKGCDGSIIPDDTQTCNSDPCNEDTLMPVNPSAPSITTPQLPYCDEEIYPEAGLDSDIMTTIQADSPTIGFAESESELGSGSGMGMDLDDDSQTTLDYEGSGYLFTLSDNETDTVNTTLTTDNSTDITTVATETTSNETATATDTLKGNDSSTTDTGLKVASTTEGSTVTATDDNTTTPATATTSNETATATDTIQGNDTSTTDTGLKVASTTDSSTDTATADNITTPATETTSNETATATDTIQENDTSTTDSKVASTTESSTDTNTVDNNTTVVPETTSNVTADATDTTQENDTSTTDSKVASTTESSTDMATADNTTTPATETTSNETSTATDATQGNDTDTTADDLEVNVTTTGMTLSDNDRTTIKPDSQKSTRVTNPAYEGDRENELLTDSDIEPNTTLEAGNGTSSTDSIADTSTVATETTSNETSTVTKPSNETETTTTTTDEESNATTSETTPSENSTTTAKPEDDGQTTVTSSESDNTTDTSMTSSTTDNSTDTTTVENSTTVAPDTTSNEPATATDITKANETTATDLEVSGSTTEMTSLENSTTTEKLEDDGKTTVTSSESDNTTDTAISSSTTDNSTDITTIDKSTTVAPDIPKANETTAADLEVSGSTTEMTSLENSTTTEIAEDDGQTTVSGSQSDNTTETAITSSTTDTTTVDNSTTVAPDTTSNEPATATDITKANETTATDLEVSGSTTEMTSLENSTTTEKPGSEGEETSTVAGSTTETVETTAVAGTSTLTSIGNETESTSDNTGPTTKGEETSTPTGSTTENTEPTTEGTPTPKGSTTENTGPTTEGTPTPKESTTENTGPTTEGEQTSTPESTDLTTENAFSGLASSPSVWIFTTPQLQCIPRPRGCKASEFGCCPDKKTSAKGPFDEGCNPPKTCGETEHGCCPDGVSVAAGPDGQGCPTTPCAETLFGCCLSDNKTAAEGNDQEGCPPPCVASEFGCCADNETEATGPKKQGCPESTTTIESTTLFTTESTIITDTSKSTTIETTETTFAPTTEETMLTDTTTTQTQLTTVLDSCAVSEFGCCYDNETAASGTDAGGCPCNATEFGCCPDGVSPAQGSQQEGCQGECRTSKYGCCSDGQTPAHGPDFEGCCLLTAFGCCPDNRKPAEGPSLEGCGCQYASYGCCPDQATAAQGPDFKGCGCQFTAHGCCPDKRTDAPGPEFEGCSCETFQFGCCPDGVTRAQGPGKQGCHCQYSENGCCGDGETPATGPNGAGCDCSSSKFGCCVDGKTEAAGPKFLGCTDVPHNPQAMCSLPSDQGPCHNFTAVWFYDLAYGGCSRFWYGGCDGNGNKFATKEECEDVCVQPAPKNVCQLPGVKGPCEGDHVRWYYNTTHEQCTPFHYGGCLGNANNFDTREVCQTNCEPERSSDQCSLPIEEGPCAGNYSRWGYNKETAKCEQFTWGGCQGNANRFSTEAACLANCHPPGTIAPQCTEKPQDAGDCSEKHALWSFSSSENRCMPFYYTGCGGNNNRFDSREGCEKTCPSTYKPDKCTLPAETGDCANYREKWFYDTAIKRCRLFYYGGCGGNENNFDSEVECENMCSEAVVTTTTIRPSTTTAVATPPPAAGARADICYMTIDAGPCTNYEARWAYDSAQNQCLVFQFGGCGGNANNFLIQEHCTYYCHPALDICQLPMQAGPCDASMMRWFYDAASDTCSQFTYGGCQGNENRFETREECEGRCRAAVSTTTTLAPLPGPEPTTNQECITPHALDPCGDSIPAYYYNAESRECVLGNIGGCGYYNTYRTAEECERRCGEFSGLTTEQICTARIDPGPCRGSFQKFYWDAVSGKCDVFAYGGCRGGPNRFDNLDECEDICGALGPAPACLAPVDPGQYCEWQSSRRYHYSATRGDCLAFVYLGCDGNDNNFQSYEQCVAACNVIRPPDTNEVLDCRGYEEECNNLQCVNGVSREPTGDGCARCVCAPPPDCSIQLQECAALICPYGVMQTLENACGRCFCAEDPCLRQNCGQLEHCLQEPYTDPATQAVVYTARCVPVDENEIAPDCSPYAAECQALRCPYGVQNTRLANGCERCSCITTETNCDMLTEECEQLKCTYGVERKPGDDGCIRCRCLEPPCQSTTCAGDEKCVVITYRDALTQETRYSAECRAVNKPGFCPADDGSFGGSCQAECNDDTDCRGVSKCCQMGCRRACLLPVAATSPPLTTTYAPDVPHAPVPAPQPEPEVSASEGGKATLRCLFHGNPPPKITWTYGEVTIDGDKDRYRLMSDGALEIVSLLRTDSGVYICVADNGLGIATQNITLIVKDPVETPVVIAGDENAAITGELGSPLAIRCLAYGYPPPSVYWIRDSDGTMVPFSNPVYEARGNVLLIKSLEIETLGHYTCQAYNGQGKAASWSIVVQAFRPDKYNLENWYLVPRQMVAPITTRISPEVTRETTLTTTTTTTTESPPIPVFSVPVSTHITPLQGALTVGDDLHLTCEVDGYPDPEVYWTKNGDRIQSDSRITISGSVSVSRLSVSRVSLDDAGQYSCHARNEYNAYTDSTLVAVNKGLVVPAMCTDIPSFANCDIIVRNHFCKHEYYSRFCCKSCVEAGQLNPEEAKIKANQPFWKK